MSNVSIFPPVPGPKKETVVYTTGSSTEPSSFNIFLGFDDAMVIVDGMLKYYEKSYDGAQCLEIVNNCLAKYFPELGL